MVDKDKKEFGAWWLWVLALFVLSIGVLTFTGAGSTIFRTIVERKVFEESYQYTAAQKAKIAEFEAQLAHINVQLNGELDDTTRQNLTAQKAAISIQLEAARRLQ